MSCELQVFIMPCVFTGSDMEQDEYILGEDITDWDIDLKFKTNLNSNVSMYFSTSNGGIVITDALLGKFIRITKKVEVGVGVYYADLTFTKPSEEPIIALRQQLEVKETYNN